MNRTLRTTANLLVLATLASGAIAARPADATEPTTTATCEDGHTDSPVATYAPSVTESGGTVTVSWQTSNRAETYVVVRDAQARNGRWEQSGRIDAGTSLSITDTPGNGSFRYYVIAQNCVGENYSGWTFVTVSGSTDTTDGTTTTKGNGRKG